MSRIVSLLALLALVLFPLTASAQDGRPITDGSRVRVWTSPASAPFIGTVTSQDALSLTLKAEGFDEPVKVQRHSIAKLELKVGGRSVGKSIRNGALIGLGLAMVWGMSEGDDSPNTFFAMSAPEKGLLFSIVTVPAGILTGAIVGSSPAKWAAVPLPQTKPSIVKSLPAPSIRVTLRF